MNTHRTTSPSGKIIAGLIIIAVGVIFLLRQMGYYFPNWLFSWPMILIVIGLINGAKTGFRNFAWITLVGLGVAFLLDQMYPVYQITRYAWPLLIIGAGLFVILSRNRSWPARARHRQSWQNHWDTFCQEQNQASAQAPTPTTGSSSFAPQSEPPLYTTNAEVTPTMNNGEFVDVTAVLGGIKRNILSKNVTGADITAFMGGAELNFAQADINGRIIIDMTLIMGGCKLIVPSNWQVISEITAIMGGIDDKRNIIPSIDRTNPKVLILKGVALMGGIEITSYI